MLSILFQTKRKKKKNQHNQKKKSQDYISLN